MKCNQAISFFGKSFLRFIASIVQSSIHSYKNEHKKKQTDTHTQREKTENLIRFAEIFMMP